MKQCVWQPRHCDPHVFSCEGVLCGGINGYCVCLEAGTSGEVMHIHTILRLGVCVCVCVSD